MPNTLPYRIEVSSAYGAPMGRRGRRANPEYNGVLRIRRVPLDSGGYDPGGAYWGTGATLWCAFSPCREYVAYTRDIREVSNLWPYAKIYMNGRRMP